MKDVFKNGGLLFIRLLIVAVMSLIVTVSIGVISIAAFTDNIGYTAYVTDKDGKKIDTYYFSTADGTDKKYDEYTEKGYSVQKMNERSKLTGKGAIVNAVSSQAISLIILTVFVYNKLFPLGNSDGNLVRFGHKKEDKLYGLKIGLVAIIPSVILFLVAVVFAVGVNKNVTVSLFTLPHFYLFQIEKAIIGGKTVLGELSAVQFILLFISLAVVPLLSFISYFLGYKDILLFEKLTYKKKK